MRPLHRARGHHRRGLAPILALVVSLGAAAIGPLPTAASSLTVEAAEASLLAWTNRDRAAIGLRPLRSDPALSAIAATRAGNLATSPTFSHEAAGGDMAPALAAAGAQWYGWGENIAQWPGGLSSTTIAAIYRAWQASASHRALLMSSRMNYVGFGVTVGGPGAHAFATTAFTEAPDSTAPGARIVEATRSGTSITFTWRGYDPWLQSHWAGIRDYDVWYRVDSGAWRLIRDNTTATTLRLASRASGHRYWLQVAARDRAGNVSRPSTPLSVWVP
jgi:uncharacterized protein YkwD